MSVCFFQLLEAPSFVGLWAPAIFKANNCIIATTAPTCAFITYLLIRFWLLFCLPVLHVDRFDYIGPAQITQGISPILKSADQQPLCHLQAEFPLPCSITQSQFLGVRPWIISVYHRVHRSMWLVERCGKQSPPLAKDLNSTPMSG